MVNFLNKKFLIRMFVISSVVTASVCGYNFYRDKKIAQKTETSSSIMSATDFILGLNKIPQLEYAAGDNAVNVIEDDDFYKTFENNNKFEIFIDKKSEKINSLHYVSSVDDVNDTDTQYLKNVYNLSFSNMSTYLFDKTIEIMDMMCTADYISSKSAVISKNNTVSEVISVGKTSEIKVSVLYANKGAKIKPVSVDIGILKGNKW